MENITGKRKVMIMISLMVGILLASLDSNIVGTVMPKIVGSLNGFDLYTWPITAYLLTMTVSMPIFGKLADVYGFKPIYIFGIIIFLAGSVLCGISQNMIQLILFRGLQGIGGAVLLTCPLAVVCILFPPAMRAKYGGFISSASGLASLVGPFLGGFITETMGWRWVFFMNIPLGIIALVISAFSFMPHKDERNLHKRIDFAGAAVMIIALIPLLLAFTLGGKQYNWGSIQIITLFVVSAAMLFVFVTVEKKAKDPLIPMSLFKNSIFNFTAIEMFLINGVLMACVIFIPLFLQGVKGASASSSGAVITPMLLSLIAGVMASGLIISKTCKYKLLSVFGFLLIGLGTMLLSFYDMATGDVLIVITVMIMGLGIGVVMAIFNVTAQNVTAAEQTGVVTSSVQFSGRIGQTMASSILGTVLGCCLTNGLHTMNIGKIPVQFATQLNNPNTIANADTINSIKAHLPPDLLSDFEKLIVQAKQVLSNSIHVIFVICTVIIVAALIIVLFMNEIPLNNNKKQTPDCVETLKDIRQNR